MQTTIIITLFIVIASFCHCNNNNNDHNKFQKNHEQIESVPSWSLFSVLESLLKSLDKTVDPQFDSLMQQKIDNNIITNNLQTTTAPPSIKSNSITLNDYDDEDRPFFENNDDNDDDQTIINQQTYNENTISTGECETINGTMGECRAPPVCLKREPTRSAFNLCKWSHHPLTGSRIPIKLCCEKRHSSTIKDLTNEADAEKQWANHLALGFNHNHHHNNNNNEKMSPFWNFFSSPMTLIQNSLIIHSQQHLQQQQFQCGRTMFHRNHRRQQMIRYVYEIPNRRLADLIANDQFDEFLNQTTSIKVKHTRSHSPRIVSGVSVSNGEIPWIVSIYLRDTFTCGGSLISDRYILTAAHCFNNAKLNDWFYIRYGSNVVHEGPAIPVKRIIIHPGYKPPIIYHDIALLELTHSIPFSGNVQPVCLATARMHGNNMIGLKATVSGYGDSNFEGKQSDFLQAVDIKVIANQFCDKNYRRLAHANKKFRYGIGRTLICAGYEQGVKDACQGDSGGPLTIEIAGVHYQIGIVSFGYRCAQPDFPGIYTAVSHYRQWILNYLQQQ